MKLLSIGLFATEVYFGQGSATQIDKREDKVDLKIDCVILVL